jgi:actin-like ATPase involved in cell morphogenesis
MRQIAIDFGTTRTKVAMFDAKLGAPRLLNIGITVPWFIPSLFYIGPDGKFLVGEDAQQTLDREPKGIVRGLKTHIHLDIKIRRNGQKVNRIELASELFKWIKNKCEEVVFHDEKISSCILTVPPPPSFDQYRIDSIKKAASLGGFEHIDVIEEPLAAARHWLGYSQTKDSFVFVFDIGGGTSDIALVKRGDNEFSIFPELPPRSFPKGGNAIDDKIWESLNVDDQDQRSIPGFLEKVRMAKEKFTMAIKKIGNENFGLLGRNITISNDIVRDASESFTEPAIDFLARFISDAENICGDIVRHSPILLVGGGYNIMGLKVKVEKIWPKVYVWEQSEFATVLGAIHSPGKEIIKEATPEIIYSQKLTEIIKNGGLTDEKADLMLDFAESIGITHIARKTIEIKIIGKTIEEWRKNLQSINYAQGLFNTALQNWENANAVPEYEHVNFLCEIVLKFDDKHWKAAFLSVLTSLELKQCQKAEEFLSIYLERNNEFKELYFLRGLIRHKEGNRLSKAILHNDAYDDFMEVLKSNDIHFPVEIQSPINEFPLTYFFIASASFAKKDFEGCARYLKEYIRTFEFQSTSPNSDDLIKLYFSKIILSKVSRSLDLEESINYSKESLDILKNLKFENNLDEKPINKILSYTAWYDWFNKIKTYEELLEHHYDYILQSLMTKPGQPLSKLADEFIDLTCDGSNSPYFKEDGKPIYVRKDFLIEIAESLAKRKYYKSLDDLLEYIFTQYPEKSTLDNIVNHSALMKYLCREKWKPRIFYSVNLGAWSDEIKVFNASKYSILNVDISATFHYKTGPKISYNKKIDQLSAMESTQISLTNLNSGIKGSKIKNYNVSINFQYRSQFPNFEIKSSKNKEMAELLREESSFINKIKEKKSTK